MTPPLPCSRRTGHAAATRRHACGHLPPSPVLASSLYGFTLQPVPGQRRLTSPSPRSFSIGGEEARRRGGSDINPPRQSNRGGGFVRPRFHPKTSSNHGGQSSSPHTHTHTHTLTHTTTPHQRRQHEAPPVWRCSAASENEITAGTLLPPRRKRTKRNNPTTGDHKIPTGTGRARPQACAIIPVC
jgi:hypothetical protein